MRILSRYLLKQHAAPFIFALGATTGIMLLNQIAKRFGDLVGKGLPASVIAEVFALSVPFIVAMTLPMAVLVAVLYTFSRLAGDNELTALKANGVSLGQLTRPLLLAATGVSIAAFLFSDHVLPPSNHRLRTLLTDIMHKKPTFSLKEQVINEVRRSSLFLRAGRIDQGTFGIRDVTVYDVLDQERTRVIYADSGRLALSPTQEDLYLTLYDGTMHEFSRNDPKIFQQMLFRREVVRVTGVANTLDRTGSDSYRGDREMGTCEMEGIINAARREEWIALSRATAVEASDLRALVGLAPLIADTIPPASKRSWYCGALDWVLPAEAEAQQGTPPNRQGLPAETLRHLNEPARQALITGKIPVPRWNEVQSYRDRVRGARLREANYLVEAHKKRAIAFAAIVFVLIGIPAALKFPRGGVGLVIGVSMAVFTIYYVGLIAGEALGNRMLVPPFWAMWSTNLIFSAVGITWLWRTRHAATPRGSGWAEITRAVGLG
ncbi:MAG: YjgP/YjgQ family permease [Gemmatimonadetes bacterium]|nr:YjgP/YjgQ family permease [Gemmatimonadota bacterium]